MIGRPILKKTLRVFLTSLLFLAFFEIFYLDFRFFAGISDPVVPLFLTLLIGLFFYDEITRFIRNFIDRNFYREIFHLSQSLNQFDKELNATLEFQQLLDNFIRFLRGKFTGHHWAFYLCWGDDYELMARHPAALELPELIKVRDKQAFLNLFRKKLDFIPLHQLAGAHPLIDRLRAELPEALFYYFFPMISFKGHIGFLLFDRSFQKYLHFNSVRLQLIHVFQKTADVMVNAQLYSEVKRKSLQDQLLLEIGKKISASLRLDDVLKVIMESISRLVSFDAGGIFLIDHRRKVLRRVITRGYNKKVLDRLHLKLNRGIYGWVITHKKPSIINDVSRSPDYYPVRESTRSQLTVPLLYGKRVMGVIAVESDRLNHFTPADLELLQTFASQAVIAIANAQLYEEALQKKRLENELLIASKVQQALLPTRPPHFEGFQICSTNIPSRIVSGDFFDVFRSSKGKLGVAIGDVSGKGAPASILMAMLYAGFKSLLKEIFPVVEVVARLNNLLTETTAPGHYATFFFGVIDGNTRRITYTNAGHNPPILLGKDLAAQKLTVGGIVLGFLKNQEFRQESRELRSGDYLILYTDGVTEVKNEREEEFGEDGLIRVLKKNYGKTAREVRDAIIDAARNFSHRREFEDDFTLVVIYVE